MSILISTNMYPQNDFSRVFSYAEEMEGRAGVEIFPLFHQPGYEETLKSFLPRLKKFPVSFHGPYYQAEHSAAPGTEEYCKTMEMFRKTLEYCAILSGRYVVFHHNNCSVIGADRPELIRISCENYYKAEEMSRTYGIPVVVENAGVSAYGTMMFDQKEFINLCRKENYQVLIDIGHANANGWNLRQVMEELKDQITAYHIHNNDGIHDGHQRILNGTLNFEQFLTDFRELTPEADLVVEYGADVADDEAGIRSDLKKIAQIPFL